MLQAETPNHVSSIFTALEPVDARRGSRGGYIPLLHREIGQEWSEYSLVAAVTYSLLLSHSVSMSLRLGPSRMTSQIINLFTLKQDKHYLPSLSQENIYKMSYHYKGIILDCVALSLWQLNCRGIDLHVDFSALC